MRNWIEFPRTEGETSRQAHDRRTDEFNVNLNRNFVTSPGDYRKDNPYYDQLRSLFEPMAAVGNTLLEALRNHGRFLGEFSALGFDGQPITVGLNSGQYRHSNGLNYGGMPHARHSPPKPRTNITIHGIEVTWKTTSREVFVCHTRHANSDTTAGSIPRVRDRFL